MYLDRSEYACLFYKSDLNLPKISKKRVFHRNHQRIFLLINKILRL